MAGLDRDTYTNAMDSLISQFEASICRSLFEEDYTTAYNIFLKMEEYGLVAKDDPRRKPSCNTFGPLIKKMRMEEAKSLGAKARKAISSNKDNTIPRYLLCDLQSVPFNSMTIGHHSDMMEGEHAGVVEIPSHAISFNLMPCTRYDSINGIVNRVEKLLKKNKKAINISELRDDLRSGTYRAFNITATSTMLGDTNIGAIITAPDKGNNIKVMKVIDYDNLLNAWIDINEFSKALNIAIRQAHVLREGSNLSIFDLFKTSDYIAKQRMQIVKGQEDHREFLKMRADAQRELEKKAKEKEKREHEKMMKEAAKRAKKQVV